MKRKNITYLTIFLLVFSSVLTFLLLQYKEEISIFSTDDDSSKSILTEDQERNRADEPYEEASNQNSVTSRTYKIVDTGQTSCFDNSSEITCSTTEDFGGQDAQYAGNQFSYTDNNDGTVTDNNTGLIWQQSADLNSDGEIDAEDKKDQSEAENYCENLEFAGYADWRLPDIKTLYSLMDFSGTDPSSKNASGAEPFINTDYFDFAYGDESVGERNVDSQWATTSIYVSTVMNDQEGMFGLNLADGRIKGYPVSKLFYVKCVREAELYGKNEFVENEDGTISDNSTGLMWQQNDSGKTVEWEKALENCETLEFAGYTDWRLPNAKELHSIVDYARSPDTSSSAAIDAIFSSTSFTNEAGKKDWGFYWSSTTHERSDGNGSQAAYISFGRALGYMSDRRGSGGRWMDVHGAGAQRSDPKEPISLSNIPNDPMNQYKVVDGALTHGPQGDVIRGENYYRCVRDL